MSDRPKLQRNEVMGQYLAVDPALVDEEKHGLTLTSDGKLRVDDPTTQARIDEALAILESAAHGNAALKLLIDAVEGKLDVPANFMADVSGLALEATLTAIKGVGWTTETLVNLMSTLATLEGILATLDGEIDAIEVKLDTPANFMADVSGLATAATLEDAMQKATGPAYNQDTDSLEAIRERCDTIATRLA